MRIKRDQSPHLPVGMERNTNTSLLSGPLCPVINPSELFKLPQRKDGPMLYDQVCVKPKAM